MTPRRFITALLLMLTLVPAFVSAHKETPSGPEVVQLHINPDDKPVAGQVSALYFEFANDTEPFDVRTCACIVEVKQDKAVLSRITLGATSIQPGGKDALIQYAFQRAGKYEVALIARPEGGASFKPFTAEFPVTVAGADPKPLPAGVWYGLIAGVLVLGALIACWRNVKRVAKR